MRKRHLAATFAACMLAGSLVACSGAQTQPTGAHEGVTEQGGATEQEEPAQAQVKEARVTINCEGAGQVAWAYEGEDIVWNDEFPYQSAVINDAYGHTITIEAKEDPNVEGYAFAKWTRDGEDFSTKPKVQVEVEADTALVAVFESTGK